MMTQTVRRLREGTLVDDAVWAEVVAFVRMFANDAPMTKTPYVAASALLAKIEGQS